MPYDLRHFHPKRRANDAEPANLRRFPDMFEKIENICANCRLSLRERTPFSLSERRHFRSPQPQGALYEFAAVFVTHIAMSHVIIAGVHQRAPRTIAHDPLTTDEDFNVCDPRNRS